MRTVFFLSLAIYFFTAAGYNDSVDSVPALETARALLARDSLCVKRTQLGGTFYVVRPEGSYTKMGFAHPVLYLPVVIAGTVLSKFTGHKKQSTEFLLSFVNPLLTALLIALLFWILKQRGMDRSQAFLFSSIAAYTTLLFPYAKSCLREPLQALLLVAFYAVMLVDFRTLRRKALCLGALAAIALLCKQATLVPFFPPLLLAAYGLQKTSRKSVLWLTFPLVLATSWWVYYWRGIVGVSTVTGYGATDHGFSMAKSWVTPLDTGLWIQFLDPHTGLFWFSPIVLLLVAMAVLKIKQRRWTLWDSSLALSIFGQAVLHAFWVYPEGEGPLGPRYLVTVTPLFFLWADTLSWEPFIAGGRKWIVGGGVLLCFLLQLPPVLIKPQQYHLMEKYFSKMAEIRHVDPAWIANLKIVLHKAQGKPEIYAASEFTPDATSFEMDLTPYRSLKGFNFWWVHLWNHL